MVFSLFNETASAVNLKANQVLGCASNPQLSSPRPFEGRPMKTWPNRGHFKVKQDHVRAFQGKARPFEERGRQNKAIIGAWKVTQGHLKGLGFLNPSIVEVRKMAVISLFLFIFL